MNISQALLYGWPGAQWSLDGDTLDGLTWLSETPPPTPAEVAYKWAEYKARADAGEFLIKPLNDDCSMGELLARLRSLGLKI